MDDPLLIIAIGALLGLALGLLGGGGGVLAVPLLVAIGEPVIVASTMSLVVVGTASAAALVPHHRAGRVDWNIGLTFGLLGAVGAVLGAKAAEAVSPEVILAGMTVMLLLGASAMIRAARRARHPAPEDGPSTESVPTADLRAAVRETTPVVSSAGRPVPEIELVAGEPLVVTDPSTSGGSGTAEPTRRPSPARMVGLGSAVGVITGFFGVGAGFVVVPALVAAVKLPIKRATATALVVIVINSAVAVAVRHSHLAAPGLTAALAVTTMIFAVVGAGISHLVPAWVLSAAFASLMLVVAAYTFSQAVPW